MQKFYLTPGPSQIYHTVPDHIREALKIGLPSWGHRSKEFKEVYSSTRKALFQLLGVPEGWDLVFLSSATEIWERLIQNFVKETSLHVVTGAFSERFFQFSAALGRSPKNLILDNTERFDPESLDSSFEPELIGITGNETSTGFWIDGEKVMNVRARFPDSIITLDLVSALPHYEVPYEAIDAFYFSVQKGFGLPAGLGVLVYRNSLIEKSISSNIPAYRQIRKLDEYSKKDEPMPTPNMLDIFLLGKICEDFQRRGLNIIRSETIYKFTLLNKAFEEHPEIQPFIEKPEHRSKTTLVAETSKSSEILALLGSKGMVIGDGYGQYKGKHIRIANFPAHSKELFEGLMDLLS